MAESVLLGCCPALFLAPQGLPLARFHAGRWPWLWLWLQVVMTAGDREPSSPPSGLLTSLWLCKGVAAILPQLSSQAPELSFILGSLLGVQTCMYTHTCTHTLTL